MKVYQQKVVVKKRDFNEVWNSGNSPKHNLHHDAEEIHPNGMKKIKA